MPTHEYTPQQKQPGTPANNTYKPWRATNRNVYEPQNPQKQHNHSNSNSSSNGNNNSNSYVYNKLQQEHITIYFIFLI